jgi:hypothetical protein
MEGARYCVEGMTLRVAGTICLEAKTAMLRRSNEHGAISLREYAALVGDMVSSDLAFESQGQ